MPDKYTLRPTDLGTPKDDFQFRFNGRDVGRTYANSTPVGPRWYWSVYGISLRGPLPEGVIVQGLVDDLPAESCIQDQLGKTARCRYGTAVTLLVLGGKAGQALPQLG